MFTLISYLLRALRSPLPTEGDNRPYLLQSAFSPANALFESADSLAGLDPHQARHLRSAALAWLSVVR